MKYITGFVLFALLVFLIVIGPIATIWALNTLFNLNIDYNFYTWLAVIVLGSALRANVTTKGSK